MKLALKTTSSPIARSRAMTRTPEQIAAEIGAVKDDRIPGLWHLPGYPELTTGQMIGIDVRAVLERTSHD